MPFRILLNDQTSNFETLVAESSDIYHHQNNIQMIWWRHKIQNNLAPPALQTVLERKTISYNFRNPEEFEAQGNRIVNSALESTSSIINSSSTQI